jgi:hypothetical protein
MKKFSCIYGWARGNLKKTLHPSAFDPLDSQYFIANFGRLPVLEVVSPLMDFDFF